MSSRSAGTAELLDHGRSALMPLLDEIVADQPQYRMIIGVGAGVRSRHIFSVGLDLGLPTGALAALSAKDAAQNAYMVSCLLAKHGFVYLEAPFVVQLLSCHAGGSARRGFQRHSSIFALGASSGSRQAATPRERRRIYLVAEVFGARSMIFVKDVDGLYTAGPKSDTQAEFIREIAVEDLINRRLPTLPIEPSVLELMRHARLARSIRLINGLVPGNLTRALAGESVGSVVVHQD